MTDLQMRTFFGFDRSGGKKGIKAAKRLESSNSLEGLESLKTLLSQGETEISAIEAAKILGGSRQRFASMVEKGIIRHGKKKLMELSDLITWVAKGVAQSTSRKRDGICSELDWLGED